MKTIIQYNEILGDFSEITVTAEIHADGDVYIKNKKGKMVYVGKLGESTFGIVPDPFYLKIKKMLK